MLTAFMQWFHSPVFKDDEDKTRSAMLLNVVSNTFIISFPIIFAGAILGGDIPRLAIILFIIACAWVLMLGIRFIMLAGHIALAGIGLITVIFTAVTLAIYNIGTIRAPATSFYILTIVMSGLIISRRAILWMAGISTITVIALLLAERNGLLPEPSLTITVAQGITFAVIFAIISVLLYLAVENIDEALARARQELAERQLTEEKLRTSEERFRAMIENISEAIALVNAQGSIYYLSPAAERILGHSNAERIGSSAFENIAKTEDALMMKNIFDDLKAEPHSTRSFSIQVRHKDGSLRWLEATATNLLDLASVQAIVMNYRDITERKSAEKEREKYIEELGKQNAELERFTYTVSHDLKSPLVTIKGFLGMLKKDLEENRQDRIQKDLERIAEAAEKMGTLLSELLELSRIGRVVDSPEEINISKLTQEALETLDGNIQARNITITVSPGLPTVYADRSRLREVLENLIDNAAKYMGDQPNPQIEIGAQQQNGEQIIFVKDNGMGINPKYHTRIFGLFEKLDAKSEGTGIGLALVKRIVETHSGRIWVESDGLGKGSRFCFTIPDNTK